MTPKALANLAHLRRARDLIDREYTHPLDIAVGAMSTAVLTVCIGYDWDRIEQ